MYSPTGLQSSLMESRHSGLCSHGVGWGIQRASFAFTALTQGDKCYFTEVNQIFLVHPNYTSLVN